jgi:hypothetical protein
VIKTGKCVNDISDSLFSTAKPKWPREMFTCDASIAFLTTDFNFTGFLTDLRCGLNRKVKWPGHFKDKQRGGCSERHYTYYNYNYYYHHHHHHRISRFSALAGKYSPILGFSNQQN